ncbi:MAG: ABC transporter ATP-binding protein [Clostridium sp.]
MKIIELKNINKTYGDGIARTIALKNINLDIDKGDFVGIIGTSGCGKSTLLNIIGCIDKQTVGDYILEGRNISDLSNNDLSKIRNKQISFIFQYFALLNDYSVYDNVELPLSFRGMSKKQKVEKVNKLLKDLNIIEYSAKKPYQLSGGQQQRVAIARCLASDANIILADEPTGALDRNTGTEVIELLKELNANGRTIILVTHDNNYIKYCNKVIHLEDGEIIN